MVIGGQAMRAYGIDRQTRDLDLWVACDRANALALARYMRHAQNVPPLELLLESLQLPNFKLTVGDPRRPELDILTTVARDPEYDNTITSCKRLKLKTRREPKVA